jgi:hypothetical protein
LYIGRVKKISALLLLMIFMATNLSFEPESCEATLLSDDKSVALFLEAENFIPLSEDAHNCSDCECCLHMAHFTAQLSSVQTHLLSEVILKIKPHQNPVLANFRAEIWKPPRA